MEVPGPTVSQTLQSPEECFGLFFDDNLLEYITTQTNRFAEKMLQSRQAKMTSLYRNWKPVRKEEIMGMLSIVLNMGVIQLFNLKNYWSTVDTTNFPFFRSVFSRDKFFQIFGTLYVGNPESTTKKEKIQPLLDRLMHSFAAAFIPHKQISVDEAVISFKGRVAFKQYLKGKPTPWGIKAYVLADSITGYLHQLCIYYGKETQLIERPDLGQTTRVMCTLVEPFKDKGYDLYVDRFYTSPVLADELTKIGMTVTGTVQANRKCPPEELKGLKKAARGSVQAFRSDDGKGSMLTLSWKDKRQIIMLSTKHGNGMQEVTSRYITNNMHTLT